MHPDHQSTPPFWDPYLTSDHPTVVSLATYLEEAVAGVENRQRRRRTVDLETHRKLLLTIASNVARSLHHGADGSFKAPLGNRREEAGRYSQRGFRSLAKLAQLLGDAGAFTVPPSSRDGEASPWIAHPETVRRCAGVGPHDLYRRPEFETIVLRQRIVRRGREDGHRLIDYPESPSTLALRGEVEEVNRFLAAASVTLDAPDGGGLPDANKALRRIFNLPALSEEEAAATPPPAARFDLGGRLYDGWWMNLERGRRGAIRIGGERVADFDFSAMLPRLAYLALDLEPPPGDLYAGVLGPEDGRWRAGIKRATNAMLSRETPLRAIPGDWRPDLPTGIRASDLRAAIFHRFAALEPILEKGRSLGLMATESRILLSALAEFRRRGTVALPMHDGVMVPVSAAADAVGILEGAAWDVVGWRLPVARKL